MKVILVNGSPNEKGCTYTALKEVEKTLNENGVETEIFWVGNKPISGCIGDFSCIKNGKCLLDDVVNVFIEKAATADGFVFGSPVHFAAASGALTSFLNRVFAINGFAYEGKVFQYKPGAAVVSCRRGGATSAFDQINKYFTITQMPIVSSIYWNLVHGMTSEEVAKDAEGMATMRTLGRNMAWLLKSIEAGKEAGITRPEKDNLIAEMKRQVRDLVHSTPAPKT